MGFRGEVTRESEQAWLEGVITRLMKTGLPRRYPRHHLIPLSMLAFFTILHLWLLHRGRWIGAGLAGAVAALSYPLGVLLVPVSAAWLLRVHDMCRST